MTNFFNEIIDTQKKEQKILEEKLKKEIAGYADEIIDMFRTRDLNLGMMTDVLQTVNNYLRAMQLRLTMSDLNRTNLPSQSDLEEVK
mgnify:CR=1 FL=1